MLTRKQLQTHLEDARVNAAPGRAQAAVEKALAREISGKTVREWLAPDSDLPEGISKAADVRSPTVSDTAYSAIRSEVAKGNVEVLRHPPGSVAREKALDLEVGRCLTGRRPRLIKLYSLYALPEAKRATDIPSLLRSLNATDQARVLDWLREL